MSPPGRPKGEYRRAQPEGTPVSPRPPPGRRRALWPCAATLVLSLTGAAAAKDALIRFEDQFTDDDQTRVTVKVVSAIPGEVALMVLYGPDASTGYSDFRLRLPLAACGVAKSHVHRCQMDDVAVRILLQLAGLQGVQGQPVATRLHH